MQILIIFLVKMNFIAKLRIAYSVRNEETLKRELNFLNSINDYKIYFDYGYGFRSRL